MKKAYKALLMVFAVLFSIWLVVTVYFYNHHTVTVRSINLDGWDLDTSGTGVQWKEITFVNKEEDQRSFFVNMIFSDKELETLNKLPLPLQRAVYIAKAFYRKSNKKIPDGWKVTVTGVALADMHNNEESLKRPWVSIEDERGDIIAFLGGSLHHMDDTNIVYIERKHGHAQIDIDQLSNIKWHWDEEHLYEKELKDLKYEIKTFNFFDRVPQDVERIFSFYGEIRNSIVDLAKGKQVKSEWIDEETSNLLDKYKYLLNDPWYVGEYNGYINVFAMAAGYYADDGYEYQEKMAEQQWFFIEENGQWVLVDKVLL